MPTDSGLDAPVDDAAVAADSSLDGPAEAADSSLDAAADAAPDATVDAPACVQAMLAAIVATPVIHYVPQPSCGGGMPVCCQGGDAGTVCGDVAFDFGLQQGDSPRLSTALANGGTLLNVTMRARVTTSPDVPVTINPLDCMLHVDTAPGATQDVQFDFQVVFLAVDGGSSWAVQNVAITNLAGVDYSLLAGSVGCQAIPAGTATSAVGTMLSDDLIALITQSLATSGCF